MEDFYYSKEDIKAERMIYVFLSPTLNRAERMEQIDKFFGNLFGYLREQSAYTPPAFSVVRHPRNVFAIYVWQERNILLFLKRNKMQLKIFCKRCNSCFSS